MLPSLSSFLHRHRRRIMWITIAGGAIALVFSLATPLRYRATMRLLIIQATSPTLDAFTAVKSSEKVGRNLSRVLASSSFLDRILLANPKVDASAFPRDERRRRRAWARMVESSVAAETSVMEVHVFHRRSAQALAIAEAVGGVLARDAREYTGSYDISVKIIDPPLATRFPVRPNIPLNVVLGLILGCLIGTAFEYLRGPHRDT
jgi:capsular polysaccharide biosynthesis protein